MWRNMSNIYWCTYLLHGGADRNLVPELLYVVGIHEYVWEAKLTDSLFLLRVVDGVCRRAEWPTV